MMTRALLVLACVAVIPVMAGCDVVPYRCVTNAQCVDQAATAGICEPDGFCSFPDPGCAAPTRRYADGAGDRKAGTCVAASERGCVTDIAGGGDHLCLVRSDHTVWCWGANDAGQLGDGTTQDRARPVQAKTPTGRSFVQVSTAENHTCALAMDHTVWCWGANDAGQLGAVNAAGDPRPDSPLPIQVMARTATTPPSFPPLLATHLATGGKHTCVIDPETAVVCWGENDSGQCGQDLSAGDDVVVPTAVPGLSEGYVDVAAGKAATAVVKDDGSLLAFGDNASGELGIGTTTSSFTPVRAKITSVVTAAGGDEHVCAVKSDSSIWCWGYGAAVGLDSGADQLLPQRILTGTSVWAGGSAFHTCAVQSAALWCWGQNNQGQLGNGVIEPNDPTVFVPARALLATVERAASSQGTTCAVTVDGELWCWGANDRGQLAQGSTGASAAVPARVELSCQGDAAAVIPHPDD